MCPAAQFGKKDAPPPAKKGAKKGDKKGTKKAAKKSAPQRTAGPSIFRTGVCTRRAHSWTCTCTHIHVCMHAKRGGPSKKTVPHSRLPPNSAAITCGALHAQAEPNIVQKIFAMPLIGGGKGVELGSEYEL